MMLRARRLVLSLAAMFMLLLGGAAARLTWLHTATHAAASARQHGQNVGASVALARRGALRDRRGSVVADSVSQVRLWAYSNSLLYDGPKRREAGEVAASVDTIAGTLAPRLDVAEEELAELLFSVAAAPRPVSRPVGPPICDPELIDFVLSEDKGGRLWRLDVQPSWTRRYPWGSTAGNLLGFVNNSAEGVAGLERGLQDMLSSGVDGRTEYMGRIAGFQVVGPGLHSVEALDGADVRLTLDMVLQQMLEEELALGCEAAGTTLGSAVLMDTWTGDILAMASAPGLDPNDSSTWTAEAQVFRPLQTINAPGSTFKPLMMAAALDLGLVAPDARIDCRPQNATYGSRTVHDTHPVDGSASLQEIIVESSNIGMSAILTRIAPEGTPRGSPLMAPVYDILMHLGLGQRTSIAVPAQAAGRVSDPADWTRDYTLVSVSFGYEMSLTTVQLAAAAATLSDGAYREPRLVAGTVDGYGHARDVPVVAPRQVFTRETADRVRGYMSAVWDNVRPGWIDAVGVPVAGKTGTTMAEMNGGRVVHSFIALVPADAPRLALAVVLEDPHGHRYSRTSTGPLVDAILARVLPYLGVEGR